MPTASRHRPETHRLEGEDLRAWATVAANSFGGPAGQIAAMHDEIVERRKWVSEASFLHALNYCMLLPGPEAQQLATYLGWLRKGFRGGFLAGGLFILPGFVSIMVLSILYVEWGDVAWVEGVFRGIAPAVIAIVAHAVWRIGKRTIKNGTMLAIAAAAFIAIFFYQLPFPLIILAAGLIGLVGASLRPTTFVTIERHKVDASGRGRDRSSVATALIVVAGLTLWLAPVAMITILLGSDSIWSEIGVFFSQAAVVTFGGAYSVLAYMAQQVVEAYRWISPTEVIDGLALAETTPGPLIQVTQFVGFLAAHRNPGNLAPLSAAVLGALLTTWVTFVPSFLWIFAGAPYVERLRDRPRLTGALSTITAAVVGVILNLGVWFGVYTLFGEVEESIRFGARLLVPDVATIDWFGVVVAIGAWIALTRLQQRILTVVGFAAAAGILVTVLG